MVGGWSTRCTWKDKTNRERRLGGLLTLHKESLQRRQGQIFSEVHSRRTSGNGYEKEILIRDMGKKYPH